MLRIECVHVLLCPEKSTWNRYIRTVVPLLFVHAFEQLVMNEIAPVWARSAAPDATVDASLLMQLYKRVPQQNECSEFFRGLPEDVREHLTKVPCVPKIGGGFVVPGEALWIPPLAQSQREGSHRPVLDALLRQHKLSEVNPALPMDHRLAHMLGLRCLDEAFILQSLR